MKKSNAKLLLVSLIALTFSVDAKARKPAQAQEIRLQDTVFKMKERETATDVYFQTHAAIYTVSKSAKNYPAILKTLNQSKDRNQSVEFTVIFPSTEIQQAVISQKQPFQE